MTTPNLDRRGLLTAAASFVLWGLMPLYWHLLKSVPALQIVAHRLLWSAVLVTAWLFWKYGRPWLREILAEPRKVLLLGVSGVLISVNWGLYIWAVNAGHVVETSLGYYINPLLNVVLGVVLLGERLRRMQWLSVALAALGVGWLTFNYGSFPWIALTLALSFSLYGLIRKRVDVGPIRGLGIENLYLVLPALGYIAWMEASGRGGFLPGSGASGWSIGIDLLLVLGGALTALPLIGFAFAVRRVPLSVIGLMQYIAPTLQLLVGVLVLGEAFGTERVIGFGFIWLALAIFVVEGGWRSRRRALAPVA